MKIETRELKPTDLDALLGLYQHLHAADDPLPDRATLKAVWHNIQDSPHFHYFGVLVDGILVSACTLTLVPNLTRGCQPYGVIENVVTHTDHRRQGHGAALLRHVLAFAWAQHCYKVMLLTGRKSEAVYRFYEPVGFDRHVKQVFLAKPGGGVNCSTAPARRRQPRRRRPR